MLSLLQENERLLWMLGIVSLLVTLAVVPWIIIKLPQDYFSKPRRVSLLFSELPPAIGIIVLLIKNLLGGVVVILGIVMLVIPGQGLLTILIGLILVDFPNKYRYQRWLVSRKPVFRSVNWLRKKGNESPFILD